MVEPPLYLHILLDRDGHEVSSLTFEKEKLVAALDQLYKSGDAMKASAGVNEKVEGYFISLDKMPEIFQVIAGLDIRRIRNNEDHTPIVITADGSFRRMEKAGGGHVIIERKDSLVKENNFHIEINWGASASDSYEPELFAIIQALRYLENGNHDRVKRGIKPRHTIEIRTDHDGIVNIINKIKQTSQYADTILPLAERPYKELWKEVAQFMNKHEVIAVHTSYSHIKPDTVRVHQGANGASKKWVAENGGGIESKENDKPKKDSAEEKPASKFTSRGIYRAERHAVREMLDEATKTWNNKE
jgi:ribonuclease HI